MSRLLTTVLISIGVLIAGAFALAAYLMTGAVALFAFAALIGLGILAATVDWAFRKYVTLRHKRDLRIRDERLRLFNMKAFRGTKKTDRFLS